MKGRCCVGHGLCESLGGVFYLIPATVIRLGKDNGHLTEELLGRMLHYCVMLQKVSQTVLCLGLSHIKTNLTLPSER